MFQKSADIPVPANAVTHNAQTYSRLMKEVVTYCGFERRVKDFCSTIALLNQECSLNLSDQDEQVLSLLFTALGSAERFRGDLHIELIHGENTATHSAHTVPLMNEMFYRAGLLGSETLSPEVAELRAFSCLGTLIHDLGEVLGEFSSLAQRAVTNNLEEVPEMERHIFKFAFELAMAAVEKGKNEIFFHTIQLAKEEFTLRKEQGSLNAESLENLLDALRPEDLSESARQRVGFWVRMFDLVELKNAEGLETSELFLAYVVKAVEHMQGTQHFIRFCAKDPKLKSFKLFGEEVSVDSHLLASPSTTVPLSLTFSNRIAKGVKYFEGEVGYLFKYAKTDAEIALACTLRDEVYHMVIDYLEVANPLFDRTVKGIEPALQAKLAEAGKKTRNPRERAAHIGAVLAEQRAELLARHRKEVRALLNSEGTTETKLLSTETRARLQALYRTAIACDYRPAAGEVLALCPEIPQALGALHRVRWQIDEKGERKLFNPHENKDSAVQKKRSAA